MTNENFTRDDVLALATQVENADAPDRALEETIDLVAYVLHWRAERKEVPFDAPRYMSSIDAATTLQMPGWFQHVWNRPDGISEAYVERGLAPGAETWGAVSGTTPDAMARALTAAWLRARAKEM